MNMFCKGQIMKVERDGKARTKFTSHFFEVVA